MARVESKSEQVRERGRVARVVSRKADGEAIHGLADGRSVSDGIIRGERWRDSRGEVARFAHR